MLKKEEIELSFKVNEIDEIDLRNEIEKYLDENQKNIIEEENKIWSLNRINLENVKLETEEIKSIRLTIYLELYYKLIS